MILYLKCLVLLCVFILIEGLRDEGKWDFNWTVVRIREYFINIISILLYYLQNEPPLSKSLYKGSQFFITCECCFILKIIH